MPVPTWNSGKPSDTWNAAGLVWGPAGSTKTNQMNKHVSLGFKKKKDGDLVPFAQGVHDGLQAHATTFAGLPVTLIALLAALTDFTAKYNAAIKGSEAQTQARIAAREVLIGLLSQLAAYVEGVALGNADTIRSAGFDPVSHDHHAPVTLTKPVIDRVVNNVSGAVQLRVNMQPNVHSLNVQYRSGSGAWLDGGSFPSSRLVIVSGLTPGTLYEFRVQAVGGKNQCSDWSDPVSHMCL